MKILGIHDGHTATAALLVDGEIRACLSEERLNRVKEWYGLPGESIKRVLEMTQTNPSEIDLVVIAYKIRPINVEKFIGKERSLNTMGFKVFKTFVPNSLLKRNWWVKPSVKVLSLLRNRNEIYSFFRGIGIPKEKIIFADHHTCHAYSTLLNWWGRNEKSLILTLDGAGDGYCSSVNIFNKGRMETLERTNLFSSLGWLYARMTQYMGMKPASHEYKVMGLAAYGKEEYCRNAYGKFRRGFFRIDPKNGMKFDNLSGCWGLDYLGRFRREFNGERFDNIAAGLQRLTEELMLEWVRNCARETGIYNVFCSGGVFMNVKANMRIMYEAGLDKFFVFPSAGDESNAIGAAIYGYYNLCRKEGRRFRLEKLRDLYWGPEYSDEDIEKELKGRGIRYEEIGDIEGHIAEKVSGGMIVGRLNGRMEFGARALGNRSIIADPRDSSVLRRINEAIKFRDFWMPFAPSILEERAGDYIIKPRAVKAPYMIMAFKTKDLARRELISALHQWDLTCRPQILEKDWNPSYYRLLKDFESLTGVGGVLNTSFNLHGDPIVCSPADALETFRKSKLDALAMGNFFITKKQAFK